MREAELVFLDKLGVSRVKHWQIFIDVVTLNSIHEFFGCLGHINFLYITEKVFVVFGGHCRHNILEVLYGEVPVPLDDPVYRVVDCIVDYLCFLQFLYVLIHTFISYDRQASEVLYSLKRYIFSQVL